MTHHAPQLSDRYARLFLVAITAIVFISATSVVGFYFYNFFGAISDDASRWGNFGDFIGGTLGSLLALLTTLALLYTIALQLRELKNSHQSLKITAEQLEKSERYLIESRRREDISNTKNGIEFALSSVDADIQVVFSRTSKFDLIDPRNIGYYFSFSSSRSSEHQIPDNEDPHTRLSEEDRISILDLIELLGILNLFLHQYETMEKNAPIVYYYKHKYVRMRNRLANKNYISKDFFPVFDQISYAYAYPSAAF